MHNTYEKDFLFISSVFDPKPTNTWHMQKPGLENEPAYEKVVNSYSCNKLSKVILLKVYTINSSHDYALLQNIICKIDETARK